MYHVHLTEAERAELQHCSRTAGLVSRTRDRLEMVRLAGAGWSSPRIARHLRMSEAGIRFWIKRYLVSGLDALPDQPHLGQRSHLAPAILAAVTQVLQQGAQTWTAAQIAVAIAEQSGLTRSAAHVRRWLKRAGLTDQRTSASLRHKPDPAVNTVCRADLETLEKGGGGSA